MKKNQWTIQKIDHEKRLLPFLKQHHELLPLKELRWAIEHNFCLVNGVPERFGSKVLKEGDTIFFNYNSSYKRSIEQITDSKIIYEDKHILAYDKPPFLPSVGPDSLETLLKKAYQPLYPVHRLDRDTTGVLLFAKTTESRELIEQAFKNREVKKSYLAVVTAKPKNSSGHIKNYLGQIKKEPGRVTYGVVSKERGLLSETHWELIKESVFEGHRLFLIRCFPLTGRTHQIRVHLKSIGCPILGDYQYGGSLKPYFPNFFLHAESLILPLPFFNKPLLINAPLPDLLEIIMGLNK